MNADWLGVASSSAATVGCSFGYVREKKKGSQRARFTEEGTTPP